MAKIGDPSYQPQQRKGPRPDATQELREALVDVELPEEKPYPERVDVGDVRDHSLDVVPQIPPDRVISRQDQALVGLLDPYAVQVQGVVM